MKGRILLKKVACCAVLLVFMATQISAFAIDIDVTPPTIDVVVNDNTVTVNATDNLGAENLLYSFDKGLMWQKENFVTASETKSWEIGDILVKDVAGNISSNSEKVVLEVLTTNTLPPMQTTNTQATALVDRKSPLITISITGFEVTVNATDNVALHKNAYSFDGGLTWQSSNVFTETIERVWNIGEILVRDSSNNISCNFEQVKVPDGEGTSPQYTPPEFNVVVDGPKVSINVPNKVEGLTYLYSYDGGNVWQVSANYTVSKEKIWNPGEIVVRNSNAIINYNLTPLTAVNNGEVDTTAPEMVVEVDGNDVTVVVTNDDLLPVKAYSFDGGKSWVENRKYTVVGEKTWAVGEILVRNTDNMISCNLEEIKAPQPIDTTAPIVKYDIENLTLTVNATDNVRLHKTPYSFDGGKTWTDVKTFTVEEGKTKTFAIGEIVVRDAKENKTANTEQIDVPKLDKTAPTMTVSVNGKVVTITAADETALHEMAYSFDNGATWQADNTYTVTGTKTFAAGTIKARDAAGNIVSSTMAYTATSTNQLACIDVSSYQGNIDWAKVKASGIDYAVMRAVTWSGTAANGYWVIDPYFESNVKNAKANGIKVGAYIYTYAFNEQEVGQEVAVFRACADKLKSQGYTFDLPVFVDYEYNPILEAVPGVARRTELLRYEMIVLDQSKYYPGMYMSTSWAQNHVNAQALQNEGYDLWIADYRGQNGYGSSVVMWQYTSKGSVNGVVGNVDMNYLYKDYSGIINGSDNAGSKPTESMVTVYDLNTKKNVTDTKLNILSAITNNEVGNINLSGGDRILMYKAQAVAANSWLMYQFENKNTIPRVGLKYDGQYTVVKSAIESVTNQAITYNGRAINAIYGSCNNGKTNTPKNYWGSGEFPYLTVVNSPYDNASAIPAYFGKTLTTDKSRLTAQLKAIGIDPSASGLAEKDWIKITSRDAATNYVTGLTICGKNVSVATFCENVYGPYSPDFTVSYSNGVWTFVSNGYGHGIGMSQLGARGYFNKGGYTWQQVLAIYYPGTKIETIG